MEPTNPASSAICMYTLSHSLSVKKKSEEEKEGGGGKGGSFSGMPCIAIYNQKKKTKKPPPHLGHCGWVKDDTKSLQLSISLHRNWMAKWRNRKDLSFKSGVENIFEF